MLPISPTHKPGLIVDCNREIIRCISFSTRRTFIVCGLDFIKKKYIEHYSIQTDYIYK